MTRTTLEEAKKSWQSGASVSIEGIPISGYGNYEDFSSARDREKRNYNFDLNAKKSSVVIQQSLSDKAYDAYVACLKQKQVGVLIWAGNTGAFASKAIINIQWNGPVGSGVGRLEAPVIIDGADVSEEGRKSIPNEWRSGEQVSLILKRHPDEDAVIVAKVAGYSETFFIPKNPPQFTITDDWVLVEKGIGTDRDDKVDFACLYAKGNETFIFSKGSPAVSKVVQGNDDPGHNKATLRTPLDSKKVCVDVYTHTSKEGVTQSIKATLTALKRTVTPK